jgi:hypothetical protein
MLDEPITMLDEPMTVPDGPTTMPDESATIPDEPTTGLGEAFGSPMARLSREGQARVNR